MRCEWKPNHVLALCVFSMLSVLGFWVVLDGWPVIGRLPEARGLWDVMACCFYLVLIFYNPTMVMWWYALWDVCIWCSWYSSVFLCEAEMFVYETLDLTIFGGINQLYLDYLFSCPDGTEVWIYIWWFHVVTCFDLTILEVFDQYYFRIFVDCLLRTEIYCDLREMLLGCLLRTNGLCDLSWDAFWLFIENQCILWYIFWDTLRLLVENHWIIWLIRDAFSCQ